MELPVRLLKSVAIAFGLTDWRLGIDAKAQTVTIAAKRHGTPIRYTYTFAEIEQLVNGGPQVSPERIPQLEQ